MDMEDWCVFPPSITMARPVHSRLWNGTDSVMVVCCRSGRCMRPGFWPDIARQAAGYNCRDVVAPASAILARPSAVSKILGDLSALCQVRVQLHTALSSAAGALGCLDISWTRPTVPGAGFAHGRCWTTPDMIVLIQQGAGMDALDVQMQSRAGVEEAQPKRNVQR